MRQQNVDVETPRSPQTAPTPDLADLSSRGRNGAGLVTWDRRLVNITNANRCDVCLPGTGPNVPAHVVATYCVLLFLGGTVLVYYRQIKPGVLPHICEGPGFHFPNGTSKRHPVMMRCKRRVGRKWAAHTTRRSDSGNGYISP
jgi:hypothetical protein